MNETTELHPSSGHIWGFLILTYLLSWPLWLGSGILSRNDSPIYDFRWLMAQAGVMGPSLAALIVAATSRRELRRNSLQILPVLLFPLGVPGILVAASTPPTVAEFGPMLSIIVIVVAAAISLFFSPLNRRLSVPGTAGTSRRPGGLWILLSVVLLPSLFLLAWLFVNLQGERWEISTLQNGPGGLAWFATVAFAHNLVLGGSLGEEIGWRGFLLPALLPKTGPLTASLILGLVWALWHLPIDITTELLGKGLVAVLIRIAWTVPLTIIFTWFYLKSSGSLLVALFLHTSVNILPDFGFSNYEEALVVLWIFMVFLAVVLAVFSREFRKEVQA